jgi:hypothetical protein
VIASPINTAVWPLIINIMSGHITITVMDALDQRNRVFHRISRLHRSIFVHLCPVSRLPCVSHTS